MWPCISSSHAPDWQHIHALLLPTREDANVVTTYGAWCRGGEVQRALALVPFRASLKLLLRSGVWWCPHNMSAPRSCRLTRQ